MLAEAAGEMRSKTLHATTPPKRKLAIAAKPEWIAVGTKTDAALREKRVEGSQTHVQAGAARSLASETSKEVARAGPNAEAKVPSQAEAKARRGPVASGGAQRPIPEKFYRIAMFPEVKANLEELDKMVYNPFYVVHDGVAANVTSIGGVVMTNFSNFNYLGYSGHPEVSQAAHDAIDRYGTSVSASRLVSGERPVHIELEQELAELYDCDGAITFPSGHHCNETNIGHIFGKRDLIVHDSLAHNCLVTGAIMSGAKRMSFPHADVDALEAILARERHKHEKCGVLLEGVYSMDGDITDLPRFVALRERYRCILWVDESHSVGVLGAHGGGTREHFGLRGSDVDVWMGTISKALGSCGGFLAGSSELIRYLKLTSPGYLFATGISPSATAAALGSLRLMKHDADNVRRVRDRAEYFGRLVRERGMDTGLAKGTAIVPVLTGDSDVATLLSMRMRDRGINVAPIGYPAVENSKARVRFFITSLHTEDELRCTADVLAEEARKAGVRLFAPSREPARPAASVERSLEVAMSAGVAPAAPRGPVAAPSRGGGAAQLTMVQSAAEEILDGAVDVDAPLTEAGLDSLLATEMHNTIQGNLNEVALPTTLIFEHPTVRQIAQQVQLHCAEAGVEVEEPEQEALPPQLTEEAVPLMSFSLAPSEPTAPSRAAARPQAVSRGPVASGGAQRPIPEKFYRIAMFPEVKANLEELDKMVYLSLIHI